MKDIRSLYWASDLLVMPSLYEGLSNSALEGCAAGLPAILSHAANVDRIVVDGTTGWEVPTLHHGPLVRALQAALAVPADGWRRWVRRPRPRHRPLRAPQGLCPRSDGRRLRRAARGSPTRTPTVVSLSESYRYGC